MKFVCHLLWAGWLACCLSFAQGPATWFGDIKRDTSAPSLETVVGHDFGEKISMHHEVLAYAKALADASPRVSLTMRGASWEGREMGLLFITSVRNQQRLDDLQMRYQKLADPRQVAEGDLDGLIDDLPVLVWLQESVHGNEISGVDSGLAVAWHLATAMDETTTDMLDRAVVMIELMQNPDGRDRFITYSRMTRSPLGGDPDPQSAERNEPWPFGRFNHYLFDMNRDWFIMSQLETQAKVATFLTWFPQVAVDLHEMGTNSTFFAAKPSPPANPLLPEDLLMAYEDFGRAIGREFDKRGIDYFQGETFDSFYPGYGEAWPSLQGAMGVLFEQASARGLRAERRDGTVLTYAESVANQAIASMAVVSHAADKRTDTLRLFHGNRRSAMQVDDDTANILLLPGTDGRRALTLARLLVDQGIAVYQLTDTLKNQPIREQAGGDASKRDVPAGTIVVPLNQPAGRLARTLLTRQLDMDKDFRERQLKRLSNRESSEIYDITAWSLPVTFGVPTAFAGARFGENNNAPLQALVRIENTDARLGFIIPRDFHTGPLLARLLREDYRLSYTTQEIRHQGRLFPAGSLILRSRDNGENLGARLEALCEEYEANLYGTDTAWFDAGPSFGSDAVLPLQAPSIAMLWGQPTNAMSAGWMRFMLEQRLHYPVTALRTERVAGYDLDRYDVLIMPGSWGSYHDVLGARGAEHIRDWVARGGVLIALDNAVEWLMHKDVGLLDTVREQRDGSLEQGLEAHPREAISDPQAMILPREESPEPVFGALLRVYFDTSHWLGYGMPVSHGVLVDSNRILRPLRLNQGSNVGRFADPDNIHIAGFGTENGIKAFAHKPFLMETGHRRGRVIAFTEDPNFRAFMRGLEPLLVNAIFYGPTTTR